MGVRLLKADTVTTVTCGRQLIQSVRFVRPTSNGDQSLTTITTSIEHRRSQEKRMSENHLSDVLCEEQGQRCSPLLASRLNV